jgi:trk system potassium uptake protein
MRQGFHHKLIDYINAVVPVLLFIAFSIVLYEFGFKPFWNSYSAIDFWLQVLLTTVVCLTGIRLLLELFLKKKPSARVFNFLGFGVACALAFYVIPVKSEMFFESTRFLILKLILYAGITLGFLTEVSHFIQFLYSRTANPGILFVGSFGLLIVLGTILLKLPNATYGSISTLEAIFTSTSAVCVTGLIVLDTATQFTSFGQLIILLLIQLGGLGFMTLTGMLAYAVAGQSSFKTQLAFTDMLSNRKISNIMHFIYKVVFVTFLVEIAGAAVIYSMLDDELFVRKIDKLFFAVFHSISAFCNAGFSTNTDGLYETGFRFNYGLQFVIALLVILGGLGFPIVFNLFRYLNVRFRNFIQFLFRSPERKYIPNFIMLNSRLALVVNAVLLGLGLITYLLLEQNNTLQQHPTAPGKIVTSFFGSVTPRTAGFNTVDLSAMSLPMIMIYIFLMWVGASPGSTGGGIKTTTAGVAFLNIVSILRGRDRSEFFHSEISHQSIRRAFAIIFASLLIIGLGIFFISLNDNDKGLIKIAFEVFSAFSTVGLSLGITASLSTFSKTILILIMFIGRIGTITLLVIFIRQSRQLYYRYPKEDIAF